MSARRAPFRKHFGVVEVEIDVQEDPHRVVVNMGTTSTGVSLALEGYEAIQLAEALLARARVRDRGDG